MNIKRQFTKKKQKKYTVEKIHSIQIYSCLKYHIARIVEKNI